jgi:hypothetical protein
VLGVSPPGEDVSFFQRNQLGRSMARIPEIVKARIGQPSSFHMILLIAFPIREERPMLV